MDIESIRTAATSATRMYGSEVILTDAQATQLHKAVNDSIMKFEEDVPSPDDLEEEIWLAASEAGIDGHALTQFISDIRADL